MMDKVQVCPKCETEMNYKCWHEEYWLVEYVYKCPKCKYEFGWAYGQYWNSDEEAKDGM